MQHRYKRGDLVLICHEPYPHSPDRYCGMVGQVSGVLEGSVYLVDLIDLSSARHSVFEPAIEKEVPFYHERLASLRSAAFLVPAARRLEETVGMSFR